MDVAHMALPARCIASIVLHTVDSVDYWSFRQAQAAGYFLRLSGISALIVKSSEA